MKLTKKEIIERIEAECPSCGHLKHYGTICGVIESPRGKRVDGSTTPCLCSDHQAKKADEGKPSGFTMLPWKSIEELAGVFAYGAKKYKRDSWRTVPDAEVRYAEALMRHLAAYFDGHAEDEESGLRHIAHAAWNVIALMELSRKS